MSALAELQARNNQKIIEGKYIDRVLKEEAINIMQAQDRMISKHRLIGRFPELSRRRFRISTNTATFEIPMRMRFIDMRRGLGVKDLSVALYNRVIFGHFNNIIGRLAYGFTEDIKNEIAGEYQIKLGI